MKCSTCQPIQSAILLLPKYHHYHLHHLFISSLFTLCSGSFLLSAFFTFLCLTSFPGSYFILSSTPVFFQNSQSFRSLACFVFSILRILLHLQLNDFQKAICSTAYILTSTFSIYMTLASLGNIWSYGLTL